MNPIRAIIIDDEPRAVNSLKTMLQEYVSGVEVIATANNVPHGVIAINAHQPDVVFLDIELPEFNGFDLLKFFQKVNFEIVFVTAYSEYALQAFEISAVDYLLKPVSINTLTQTIEKLQKRLAIHTMQDRLEILSHRLNKSAQERIALPMAQGLQFVEVTNLLQLEADGSYTRIFLRDGSRYVVTRRLKFFEDVLAQHAHFFRVHRSNLININCITQYLKGEGTILLDGNHVLSISRDRKVAFEQLLRDMGISLL